MLAVTLAVTIARRGWAILLVGESICATAGLGEKGGDRDVTSPL